MQLSSTFAAIEAADVSARLFAVAPALKNDGIVTLDFTGVSGTEFVILPGVGHLSPLESPRELAAAITKAVSDMR